MRICDILQKKKTFSFEVFPPNPTNSTISDIFSTIDKLQQFNPDFISVTFKASGDFSQNTIDLAAYIKKHTNALFPVITLFDDFFIQWPIYLTTLNIGNFHPAATNTRDGM